MHARDLTIGGVVRANAFLHADRDALVDEHLRIPHREFERRTNRLARTLLEQGVSKGDRIALLLPDGVQFVELLVAAGKIGAIAVLLNWRLSPSEIAWILENSTPSLVYFAERFAHLLPSGSDVVKHAVIDDATAAARYERWATGGSDDWLDVGIRGDDPLFMMFTSGTTGRPKGCLQSHEGTVVQALAFAARRGLNFADCNLAVNPLFHVGGLGQLLSVMLVGGANCFVSREAGVTAPIDVAIREACTTATLGKPLIAAYQAAGSQIASSLGFRTLTWGAGIVDPASVAFVRDDWGALVVGGWGQTESWGFSTFIDYPEMLLHPKSLGWALQHVTLAILDERGRPHTDPEAIGELGVRGPSVMVGYWNNPEASEAALGSGWLRTGDVMRRDELGLFTMKGRVKELIKSGGENVYPAEVEAILKRLPGVVDAAVAGVSDEKWGEAVKAFFVLGPNAAIDIDAMTAACRASIAGYKRPRYVEVVEEIHAIIWAKCGGIFFPLAR